MDKQNYLLQTKFGSIYCKPTQADHIYMDMQGNYGQPCQSITVNNVAMTQVSAHMYLWTDGKFHLGMQKDAEWEQNRSLYTRRSITEDASDSARTKLKAELERVVNEWVKDNAPALKEAQYQYLLERKESVKQEIEKARKELNEKQEKLNDLYEKLKALCTEQPA